MSDKKPQKIKLPNVTLIAASSVNIYEAVKALKYSMRGIDFGEVVLVTHRKPLFLPKEITYKHCEKLSDIDKFNYLLVYDLGQYVNTDYIILVHADGFIVHPEKWQDEFLNYDYIGSPWPLPTAEHSTYYDVNGNICRVGNSVSLRSKRLLDFPKQAGLKWEPAADGYYNEDIFLCCMNKHRIEEAGMKIAPIEVARYFGREHTLPETEGIDPFLFHKWWGENADFPRFQNPVTRVWLQLKAIRRKLMFWRKWD